MEILRLANRTDTFYDKESSLHLWYYNPSGQVSAFTKAIETAVKSGKLIHVNAKAKIDEVKVSGVEESQPEMNIESVQTAEPVAPEVKEEEAVHEQKAEEKAGAKGKKNKPKSQAAAGAKSSDK